MIRSWTPGRTCARIALVAAISYGSAGAAAAQQPPVTCMAPGPLVRIAELPEGSGAALSRRTPGRLWVHNDSGEPLLLGLDVNGTVATRVRLAGAEVEDWEAMAMGPCPAGTCLYVGDIGDNDGERDRITVYRVPEPNGAAESVRAEAFHATYPDGAHDAETLFIAADGRLHIVTKGDTGPVALYRFPAALRPGGTARLERVGQPREAGRPSGDRITDGAASPDGRWVVLRSEGALMFYAAADLLAGRWREAARVELKSIGEMQGEGLSIGPNGDVYLVGEGGGESAAGTLVRLTCDLAE